LNARDITDGYMLSLARSQEHVFNNNTGLRGSVTKSRIGEFFDAENESGCKISLARQVFE